MERTVSEHTPGPWAFDNLTGIVFAPDGKSIINANRGRSQVIANARLVAAAPEMLAALCNVQRLITEAAMIGFNHKDGDWPERLFLSQQVTSAAIAKATTTHNGGTDEQA